MSDLRWGVDVYGLRVRLLDEGGNRRLLGVACKLEIPTNPFPSPNQLLTTLPLTLPSRGSPFTPMSSDRSPSNSPAPEDEFSESDQPAASTSKLPPSAAASSTSTVGGKGKGKAGAGGEERIKRKSGKKGKKFVEDTVCLVSLASALQVLC